MTSKIALIDDEEDFVELTSAMLEFHDFDVETFSDPLEFVKDVGTPKFALIVSDLMMPNIDGFHLLEKIRSYDHYKKTPIIVLTAKSLSDDERKHLFQHDAHLLIKPFEPQGLVDLVKSLLADSNQ